MKEIHISDETARRLRYRFRCADARAYARKLRRNSFDHEAILLEIKEIWGQEVSQHIDECKAGYYYAPSEDDA